ncbi:class A beta-lactamase [Chitinimonas sp.]|uniref:class A beta-lactamase n=1 Tax=Chitinimonas sp. TaxID=1934313 RepID=UPI0035B24E1C
MKSKTLLITLAALPLLAQAGSLDTAKLQADLDQLAQTADGRLGVCVQSQDQRVCSHGDTPLPMQSVFKLAVAVAVMQAVDEGKLALKQPVTLSRRDLSVWWQPITEEFKQGRYQGTVADLLDYMLTQSDNAATDALLRMIGGPGTVQAMLSRAGIAGMNISRDERHLQTDLLGLRWQAEFTQAKVFEKAVAAIPDSARQAALDAHLADSRDKSTPAAMSQLLRLIADGKLLSPASNSYLLDLLAQCATGADRLKAGLPQGWKLGHKTGTSGDFKGYSLATNDVGIVTAPDGSTLAVAVLLSGSRKSPAERAALIAEVSRRLVANYRAADIAAAQ